MTKNHSLRLCAIIVAAMAVAAVLLLYLEKPLTSFFQSAVEYAPGQVPASQGEAAPPGVTPPQSAAPVPGQVSDQLPGQVAGQAPRQDAPPVPPTESASPATPAPAREPGPSAAPPSQPGQTPPDEDDDAPNTLRGTLERGDTVVRLLSPLADADAVQEYVNAIRRVFPLKSFRAGHPYLVVFDEDTRRILRFEYEIDDRRRLVAEGDGTPVARVENIDYESRLVLVQGRIEDSLFQSVADLGETPQLALLLARLFAWEINFIRDIEDGDSFSILLEKLYRDGAYKTYGRVLGATFTNKGKKYEAFRFNGQYYNTRGENLRKVLLQSPLSFTRVTSGFSKSRKHPILGTRRPHLGVDYGAPTGTPVKAVGDGVVVQRGRSGGYGNLIVLRHGAGLSSHYGHLAGYARGLRQGGRVRQGQVIGFVGSTGLSTGPHLDFRLSQGGRFINPLKAVNPRSAPVPARYRGLFRERMALVRDYMDGRRSVADYRPDVFVRPEAPAPLVIPAAGKDAPPKALRGKKTSRKTVAAKTSRSAKKLTGSRSASKQGKVSRSSKPAKKASATRSSGNRKSPDKKRR